MFVIGSLVCGLSESLGLLLAARAVQGIGAAAILVTAHTLLTTDRAGAHAWRLASLLGFAAGPALGGALTQGFGWRSIFLLQAPAALAALPASLTAGSERPAIEPSAWTRVIWGALWPWRSSPAP